MRSAWFVSCGRLAYADAWELQRALLAARQTDAIPDTLVFVEHPPVVTLGRGARDANILAAPEALAARGVEVFRIERGGDVTYHGPGQLVGYPILNLRALDEDVVRYVRTVEGALIGALAAWEIPAERVRGFPGVWVGGAKVAAIGVAVKRKVTMHGFALNVDPDLGFFDLINPCGLGRPVTSMARILGRAVTLDEVAPVVASALAGTLRIRLEERTVDEVRAALSAAALR